MAISKQFFGPSCKVEGAAVESKMKFFYRGWGQGQGQRRRRLSDDGKTDKFFLGNIVAGNVCRAFDIQLQADEW